MKKLFGLGKGLSSLIPPSARKNVKPEEDSASVFYVETGKVRPNPNQPRKDFDPRAIEEMAASIIPVLLN